MDIETAPTTLQIGLLPDEPFMGALLDARRRLSAELTTFDLYAPDREPNLTLLGAGARPGNVDRIAKRLRDPLPATINGSLNGYMRNNGYLALRIESEEIRALHARVVAAYLDAVGGTPPLAAVHQARWERFSEADKDMLRRYGSRRAMEAFDPHFTLCTVAPEDEQAALDIADEVFSRITTCTFSSMIVRSVDEGWEHDQRHLIPLR